MTKTSHRPRNHVANVSYPAPRYTLLCPFHPFTLSLLHSLISVQSASTGSSTYSSRSILKYVRPGPIQVLYQLPATCVDQAFRSRVLYTTASQKTISTCVKPATAKGQQRAKLTDLMRFTEE